MRIVFLLESTGLWGGVKSVLEAANRLADRGHQVQIVTRDRAPLWIDLRCQLATVPDLSPAHLPTADVIVGTFWTTVPHAVAAAAAGLGTPVHYCQGYEGENPENAALRQHIEQVYRLSEPRLLTISPHLTDVVQRRFGRRAREVRYAIDHAVMFPGRPRPVGQKPVRVGLVGPYDIVWKDLPTGLEACSLAQRAGLELQVVRITNTSPHPREQSLALHFDWHVQVPPRDMGELYRSMDVFVGSSRGEEEGFFMPAVEAMACGVPSVLTDIPCHRGYAEGPYALFVPPRDPRQMAEALVIAAGHPQVRSQLREQGLAAASRYHFDDHVADLERAFAEICGGSEPTVIPSADPPRAHQTVAMQHP